MSYSTEDKDCCTYPKGVYFDYVRGFKRNGKFYLEGKGKYGCVTKLELSPRQQVEWMRKYRGSKKKGEQGV